MIQVHILTALTDNYIYVLRDETTNQTAVVDPSEAAPVIDLLSKNNWPLNMILNTHHHHDHVGGNNELKALYNCLVYTSEYDFSRIPGATHKLKDNDSFAFGAHTFQVIEVPGHTLGAIAFYSSADLLLFTGDTLFTLGCGRLFEGTPEQLWTSLKRLAELPNQTLIYCGHEYGIQNAGFALCQNPQDAVIKGFFNDFQAQASRDGRSVPSTIEQEKRFNPFMKAQTLADFTELRRRKDDFRLENMGGLG